ncbi:DNA methyltransferase, partial [Acinetobacter nosocomialis]|uniref:DNA methyltransferase n=1 Tax=Acinetobacter nosocomialis TaxID=106654 RepID=UPI000AA6C50B
FFKHTSDLGIYRLQGLRKRGAGALRSDRPNMYFPIYLNKTTQSLSLVKIEESDIEIIPKLSDGQDGRWRWGKDTFLKKNQFLIAKKVSGRNEYDVFEKVYLETEEGKKTTKLKSFILDKECTTDNASSNLRELFRGNKVFETPKPLKLIEYLFYLANLGQNDKVLDFFSGSGTTAHAVLKKNVEDGSSLQFICIQINENISEDKEAYKVGYRTIFEITKDRIIKASEKLAHDHPDTNVESGFKVFKTCDNFLPSSNYRELKQLTLSQSDTPPSTAGFDDAQLQDILTTWKGLDKILLSENLNLVNLGNYLAYGLGHVLYLVNKSFNTDALKVLIQKLDDEHEFQVSKLVILGHHFDSKSQREIDEAMKNYNNKKSIPVDVVVRY